MMSRRKTDFVFLFTSPKQVPSNVHMSGPVHSLPSSQGDFSALRTREGQNACTPSQTRK